MPRAKKTARRAAAQSPVDIEFEVKRRAAMKDSVKHVRGSKKQELLTDVIDLQHRLRGNPDVADRLQTIRNGIENL